MKTQKIILIAVAMLLLAGASLFGADAADQALDQIKASVKDAIAETMQLTTQSTNIRTVSDAVTALTRFYGIIQRLNETCVKIIQDLGADADTKKLSAGIAEIRKQTQVAGANFAVVLGKLPQAILTSEEFLETLQKISDALGVLNSDLKE